MMCRGRAHGRKEAFSAFCWRDSEIIMGGRRVWIMWAWGGPEGEGKLMMFERDLQRGTLGLAGMPFPILELWAERRGGSVSMYSETIVNKWNRVAVGWDLRACWRVEIRGRWNKWSEERLQLTSIQKLTFGIDCAKNILK
jgi:hypothetical protein